MTQAPIVSVARVLPRTGAGTLTAPEALAILKVAFLATEADGRVADEEQDSFDELAEALRALSDEKHASLSDEGIETMLDELIDDVERVGRDGVLKKLVPELARPLARDLAYKVAFAMTVADLDRADEKSDFDEQLMEALSLTDEQADVLAGDVYAALEDEEDEEDDDD